MGIKQEHFADTHIEPSCLTFVTKLRADYIMLQIVLWVHWVQPAEIYSLGSKGCLIAHLSFVFVVVVFAINIIQKKIEVEVFFQIRAPNLMCDII